MVIAPLLSRGESEVVLHAQRGEHLFALRHQNNTGFSQLMRHAPVDALAPQRDRAVGDRDVLGRQKAEMARNVVVLPAPLVPTSATISPSGTSSDTPWIAVATRL